MWTSYTSRGNCGGAAGGWAGPPAEPPPAPGTNAALPVSVDRPLGQIRPRERARGVDAEERFADPCEEQVVSDVLVMPHPAIRQILHVAQRDVDHLGAERRGPLKLSARLRRVPGEDQVQSKYGSP